MRPLTFPAALLATLCATGAARAETFVVDSTLDLPDEAIDGVCLAVWDEGFGLEACTLRAALMEANATPESDTILWLSSLAIEDSIIAGDYEGVGLAESACTGQLFEAYGINVMSVVQPEACSLAGDPQPLVGSPESPVLARLWETPIAVGATGKLAWLPRRDSPAIDGTGVLDKRRDIRGHPFNVDGDGDGVSSADVGAVELLR